MENKAFGNSPFKRYQGTDEEICEIRCYLEPSCVAYSYGPVNDELSVCEMSDSQPSLGELQSRNGFIYRSIHMVRKLKAVYNYFSYYKKSVRCYNSYSDGYR